MTGRPGLVVAGIFFCLYGALALTVDLPKATYGFKSDEATYYMMGLSLARDGDLTYRKKDLVRVWEEFSSGPQGVFLKRGQTIGGAPDPDQSRYFYGKSFIYPLFAAPFIVPFGSNGFLILNALALALVLLCAYLFLHARSGPWPSAILASAFVMVSVVPVYFAQMMPEVFNFSLACVAYFCWLYKEVATPDRSPRGTAWLFGPRSDIATAVLLGIATFSKPTNALLFGAPFLWWAWRIYQISGLKAGAAYRSLAASFLVPTAVFLFVAGGLFTVNMAITGDWNYQGGGEEIRRSYYHQFPFQNQSPVQVQTSTPAEDPERQLGVPKSRDTTMWDVIFNPRTFSSNLRHNLYYFFIGRYAGLAGYFFPGLFAMVALLAAPRHRPGWQWLVLAAALAQGLIFVVGTPYTWSGGGVGNRYLFGGYGVMLFLLPPVQSLAVAVVPWLIGGLFVAKMVLNPFLTSFKPNEHAKTGPLRMFPVELTLLNDLPVFTEGETRARVWYGDLGLGDPGFLVSYLDDNVFGQELDKSFWTRGDSRAELVFKADKPIRRAVFTVAAGPVPIDVTLRLGSKRYDVHVDPESTQQISASMPAGLMYEKEVQGGLLWHISITTRGGFTPIFYDEKATDARYLGARIKPMLEMRPLDRARGSEK